MTTADTIQATLKELADPEIAKHSCRFFKTGAGEYGEGDRFLGIRVPVLRKQVRHFQELNLEEVEKLLISPFHEIRLFSLLLMVDKYARGDEKQKSSVYRMYMDHSTYVNNWDLVDSSAPQIVGVHLEGRDRRILYTLAQSQNLWERRIAIMATLHFIRNNEFDDTLKLSAQLLRDPEDLIHKAVGWMLREVGKRDIKVERIFLNSNYRNMPRTMLRYAIEKFPDTERKMYLDGRV